MVDALLVVAVAQRIGTLALQLLAALCFAVGGLYHIRRADYISAVSVQNIQKMPRSLQFLFPIRWYGSKSFIWLTRAGGVVCLLVSLFLFALFTFSLIHVITQTI
jgi:hypothetical protein